MTITVTASVMSVRLHRYICQITWRISIKFGIDSLHQYSLVKLIIRPVYSVHHVAQISSHHTYKYIKNTSWGLSDKSHFTSENGGSMALRNVGSLPHHYTMP
jgi:hypothetical protein